MEHQGKASVVFDYTSFLGDACSKKWTFLEALSTIAPVFSIAWNDSVQQSWTPEERLMNQAMRSLSASHSDESNIHTLLELAKSEGIHELRVVMPYELEQEQLDRIQQQLQVHITYLEQDELMVEL
ncbi:transporter [Vibrio panuliri]|uniref:Transporter n=1 Tax=Vibrio panuliri TaxID=1381081 RepID=A0A1Q9HIX9_9VIBR|nr:transporter [Vibrio panuliri]KAB1454189.1 transporter [Vibrio panuliri]OLQ90277.1 transporter [Vibrio panuliri]OLQ96238.1 transporter [Vibrio panuliri]